MSLATLSKYERFLDRSVIGLLLLGLTIAGATFGINA